MYSDMSSRTIACSSSNRNSARARAVSVFPTPVGPRKMNEPMGRFGSCSPARARRTAAETACTASSWPTTRSFRRSSIPRSFSTSPSSSFETGIPVHFETTSAISSGVTSSRSIAPPFWNSASRACASCTFFSSSGSRPNLISAAFWKFASRSARACSFRSRRSPASPRRPPGSPPSRRPSGSCRPRELLLQLGELLLGLREPRARRLVLLLHEPLPLDLELGDPAADLVHLGRHRVDLDAEPARRLVHEVDRLVRQEAVGDVAVRQARRVHEGRVLDPDLVVQLVAVLEAAQDRRSCPRRDGSPTNTGWKRRSSAGSFSTCLRYSFTVVAPMACSSPRASAGFSMLPASIAPSAAPAPTMVCISSMKRTTFPSEATTSFSTALSRSSNSPRYFAPGDHRGEVEGEEPLPLQPLRHVAVHDPPREPLDDGGLADARVADQHRVVLRAAGEDLHDAPDLVVAPDHRVELPLPGELGEVLRVLLERAVLALGLRAR